MDNEKYQKSVFQLNELIMHLLLNSNDIKSEQLKFWLDYWARVESENQEVFNEIYIDKEIMAGEKCL